MSNSFIDSRGGCSPVLKDVEELIVRECQPAECGDKMVGVPGYNMVVTNPSNLLLQEDTGVLIREDNGDFFTVD